MVPGTWPALLVLVVAVLPGAMFTYGFERQAGAFGVTLADRVLRFLAVSVVFDLLYAWPAYLAYRLGLGPPPWDAAEFAVVWCVAVAFVVVPAVAGRVVGNLYATQGTRARRPLLRRLLTPDREARLLDLVAGRAPAPRAWDNFFARRPTAYLRIRTTDGRWVGGRFAARSYAGRFPHEPDLFIEEAWSFAEDGTFGDESLGYPVFIPAGTIALMDVLPEAQR